jgi:hypothetical protein
MPAIPAAAPLRCPQDWSYTFYDAKVTIPITVCSRAATRTSLQNSLTFTGAVTTTFRLTDLRGLANLETAGIQQPPFVCTTSNGPWSARIESERACILTCSPVNFLTVIGVPNNVAFAWYGRFDEHPPGFEFVGTPVQTDQESTPCPH